MKVKKRVHNEILSEENYIKAKNSHAVFYIARRIGIMPCLKKKKKISLISQSRGGGILV